MVLKSPRYSERNAFDNYKSYYFRIFHSFDSLPKHFQSGISVLGSLLILVILLGLVGHQAEIHETVIRQTRKQPQVSDWPIHCPVPLTTDLPNKTRVHHSPQSFQLRIKVLAYARLNSLTRCLNSLVNAHYDGDVVRLHILLDHHIHTDNLTKIAEKLANARQILKFIDEFSWPYGPKDVHYRTSNAGLQAQWLEAWWPSSESEFALILEDDVEISPHFYRFLRTSINKYYFDSSNFDPSLFAISLQRPRFVPGVFGNPIRLENSTNLFLYQMVGSFGLLLFPKQWKEFRLWYDAKKSTGFKPVLEGLVTTSWYKTHGENLWLPWLFYFIHIKKYLCLFYNLPEEQSLAVSHRDAGNRFTVGLGPESDLLTVPTLNDKIFSSFPSVNKLPRYDLCFEEFSSNNIARATEDIENLISKIHMNQTIILVNAIDFSESMIKNWLCHVNNIPLNNFCIISEDNRIALELSRRGIPVILVHNLELKGVDLDHSTKKSTRSRKKFGKSENENDLNFQKWKNEHVWVDTIAYVLQLGYNVISTRVDLLWMKDVSRLVDFSSFDLTIKVVQSQRCSFDLFALKCSKSTQQLWTNFMDSFIAMVKNEANEEDVKEIVSTNDAVDRTIDNGEKEDVSDVKNGDDATNGYELMKKARNKKQVLEKLFLQSIEIANPTVRELDDSVYGSLDDVFYKRRYKEYSNVTQPVISVDLNNVRSYYELQSMLDESSLWVIDEDLACEEIVCKRATML